MVKRRAGRKRRAMALRQPSGQIRKSAYAERIGPTPEALRRREKLLGSRTAQGEIDCVLDVLAGAEAQVITQKQAEAGRRYAQARAAALRAAGINPAPASPRLADWIDRGGIAPISSGDDGAAAHRWRRARMCVFDCGADVRRIVGRVCLDNAPPRDLEVERLRIGLDALVRLWRL